MAVARQFLTSLTSCGGACCQAAIVHVLIVIRQSQFCRHLWNISLCSFLHRGKFTILNRTLGIWG